MCLPVTRWAQHWSPRRKWNLALWKPLGDFPFFCVRAGFHKLSSTTGCLVLTFLKCKIHTQRIGMNRVWSTIRAFWLMSEPFFYYIWFLAEGCRSFTRFELFSFFYNRLSSCGANVIWYQLSDYLWWANLYVKTQNVAAKLVVLFVCFA